jgi:hypothetical protein
VAAQALAAQAAIGAQTMAAQGCDQPPHTALADMARQRPGLRSIDFVYGPGRFYNLGPRPLDDPLPGQHVEAPRLVQQQGALLLVVPSPREATVPHRELPGLQRR